jgi:hypothetical protein
MQLIKNPRFLKEYEDFKSRISKIPDASKQSELQVLLGQLVSEVKALDIKHNDLGRVSSLPSGVSDTREALFNLRKTLSNRLSDYEKLL